MAFTALTTMSLEERYPMTTLFTQRRRLDVLDKLTSFFATDNAIAGLVLVGSSVEDDMDDFSGLDLLVVIANGAVYPSVYRKWKTRLYDLMPLAYEFELEASFDHAIYSMMLHNFLEINLYFSPLKTLVAHRQPWHVIFDHSPNEDIQLILEASYQRETVIGPARRYQHMMTSIWQPIIKCVAALSRNEIWRSLHMLDGIRQQTIELASLNYDVDSRNYTEIDKLPEMFLIHLRHSLPVNTDKIAIRRALQATTNLFFQQAELFEEGLQLKLAVEVRDKMQPYIEAYA